MALGNLGPVSEGLFVWIFGLGIMVGYRRLARHEGRVTCTSLRPTAMHASWN